MLVFALSVVFGLLCFKAAVNIANAAKASDVNPSKMAGEFLAAMLHVIMAAVVIIAAGALS